MRRGPCCPQRLGGGGLQVPSMHVEALVVVVLGWERVGRKHPEEEDGGTPVLWLCR